MRIWVQLVAWGSHGDRREMVSLYPWSGLAFPRLFSLGFQLMRWYQPYSGQVSPPQLTQFGHFLADTPRCLAESRSYSVTIPINHHSKVPGWDCSFSCYALHRTDPISMDSCNPNTRHQEVRWGVKEGVRIQTWDWVS